MCNLQPVFPIDIQYNLNAINDADEVEHPFNKETFDKLPSITLSLRQKIPTESRQKHHETSNKAATRLQPAPYLTNFP